MGQHKNLSRSPPFVGLMKENLKFLKLRARQHLISRFSIENHIRNVKISTFMPFVLDWKQQDALPSFRFPNANIDIVYLVSSLSD